MAVIIGTSSNNTITPTVVSAGVTGGTPSNAKDTISGLGGHDTIDGGGGSDRLYGGSGDDHLNGGVDLIMLSNSDSLYGESGNDTLTGNGGEDSLFGGTDSDLLWGGTGNDRLFGGSAGDELQGGAGNDTMFGGADSDSLNGGSGNDTLYGGAEGDEMAGGAEDDRFVFTILDVDLSGFPGQDDIHDFGDIRGNNDIIDLSAIDADVLQGGNQAFVLGGSFTIGHLITFATVSGTTLVGNIDTDGQAELNIHLDGISPAQLDSFDIVL